MKILVGITGASGSILGLRLIETLREYAVDLSVTVTKPGIKVCHYETGIHLPQYLLSQNITQYDINDLFAPPASGSYRLDAVIVIPCSMGTLARIAQGISGNLLERASDVMLKERKTLILSARETPLNSIHLENMLTLSRTGAIITPPSIAFYTKPTSLEDVINFQTGKILDILGLDHSLFNRWSGV